MAAFEIDGRDYPIPSVFQLTMGEAQVLYDYSGYTLEDFVPPMPGEPDDQRLNQLRDPAFKRAMVHIAYQRGNPDTPRDEIATLVDGVQMFDMVAAMYKDGEADDPTPSSQKQPESRKPPRTVSSGEDSGSGSENTSERQDGIRAPIGTTG